MKNVKHEFERFEGRLDNFSRIRTDSSFVMSSEEQSLLGGVAIAAAAVGEMGQATTTAIASHSVDEPADWVEFDIDGRHFKGWLWRCPFKRGDEVQVVAERQGSEYFVYAVARPADRLVALYPHCTHGTLAHWKTAFFLSFKVASFMGMVFLAMTLLFSLFDDDRSKPEYWLTTLDFFLMTLEMTYGMIFTIGALIAWRWMTFVKLAEQIFTAFGWENVKNINLLARSKSSQLDCASSNIAKFSARLSENAISDANYGAGFFRY